MAVSLEDMMLLLGQPIGGDLNDNLGRAQTASADNVEFWRRLWRDDFANPGALNTSLGSPLSAALVTMGGAAAGGAFRGMPTTGTATVSGSNVAAGSAAPSLYSGGGFTPAAGGGLGANLAQAGLRAGAGALLSGGSGGGNGGGMATSGSLLEQLAARMFEQTDPVRQSLLARSGRFLNGGIGASPQFSAFRAQAEPQYAQARDNIIGSTPNGGGLTAALADLEMKRARAFTEARGAIDQQELGLAERLATGGTGQAVSTLGTAGSLNNQSAAISAQSAQAESMQEMAILSALGQGAGAYFGSKD